MVSSSLGYEIVYHLLNNKTFWFLRKKNYVITHALMLLKKIYIYVLLIYY
jgi:hypothetical protein